MKVKLGQPCWLGGVRGCGPGGLLIKWAVIKYSVFKAQMSQAFVRKTALFGLFVPLSCNKLLLQADVPLGHILDDNYPDEPRLELSRTL